MRRAWLVICLGAMGCGSVGSPDDPDAHTPIGARVIDAPDVDAATCVTSPASVQARWRAETNTDDDTGVYDGVASGGFGYTAGAHGQAFLFDGIDDYVSADPTDALYPSGSFSIEAWVKTTHVSGTIVNKYDGAGSLGSDSYWTLVVNSNGDPAFLFRAPGSAIKAVTGTLTPVGDGNWHHVVGVRDVTAGQQILYVDGVLSVSQAITGAELAALGNGDAESDPVTIGVVRGSPSPVAEQLNGAVDEVAYYNAALSANEIAGIHAAPDGICP